MTPPVPFRHAMRFGRLAAAMGILHGCAGTPPATPTAEPPLQGAVPAPTVVLPSEPTAYELSQRERALGMARQGRLAEAALIWELLTTIRPKVAEYRERATELQRQIDALPATVCNGPNRPLHGASWTPPPSTTLLRSHYNPTTSRRRTP